MPNTPFHLVEKIKAKIVGQVTEIADEVCNRMVIASAAVLLKNRNGPSRPGDVIGFVGHSFSLNESFKSCARRSVARVAFRRRGIVADSAVA
jgi:hypothetical protein